MNAQSALFDLPDDPAPASAALQLNSAQAATLERLMQSPTALLEVNRLRLEQVTKHGHSDEADALCRFRDIIAQAEQRIGDGRDLLGRGLGSRETARMKFLKAAAILMAVADKIELEEVDDANL